MTEEKNKIHRRAKERLSMIREKISVLSAELENKDKRNLAELKRLRGTDRMVHEQLLYYNAKRLEELKKLYPSPYFVRCDVRFDGEPEEKTLYFAKFPYTEESIYSWVAPIASIRFEACGRFSYARRDGEIKHGLMLRKDQFMIIDGKIVYLTSEETGRPRTLVYQEYFSTRKTGFVLPEIIERMEKAQDQVIRADCAGPFVISGPAGSGKTTLALHRAAYLAQSPETAERYGGRRTIVFVQDAGTKDYFSHLLPELGIEDVNITTVFEWAAKILGLSDELAYTARFGGTEAEKDAYEYEKNRVLAREDIPPPTRFPLTWLEKIYRPGLSPAMYNLFEKQKNRKLLDRFDLTLLLKSSLRANGWLAIEEEYYVTDKNYLLTRKTRKKPIEYSLIIIDEFQNYLPSQLAVIRGCVDKLRSLLYIGDLGQQINLFTVKTWEEIGEEIKPDRHIRLDKVYRNTGNILKYIKDLGYGINIPDSAKSGVDVEEAVFPGPAEEIGYIEKLLEKSQEKNIIGIIAAEKDYLEKFKKSFQYNANVHILTMNEAQGVEFDVVCLVGANDDWLSLPVYANMPSDFIAEKKRVKKDLLYVAMTRAISELHILGKRKLSDIFKEY
ncbi:MAG: 3'-5' exonuclease [Candidatus Falkowbacteria bacterium]